MKKALFLILALLICVPAVIAFVSYRIAQNAGPDADTVSSMTLTEPDGTVHVFSGDKGDDSEDTAMIRLFVSLIADGSKVPSLPVQLDGQHYSVILSSKPDVTYRFYFTASPEICYSADDTRIFKLNADETAQFLKTPYAACLYASSALPVLTLSGQTVAPSAASWYYKTYDGSCVLSDSSPYLTAEPPRFALEGGLGIAFSEQPAACTIRIVRTSDDSEVFSGAYSELSALDLSDAGTVGVTVSASWERSDDSPHDGEVTYSFTATVAAPAEFYLMTSGENQVGDVVTLTAYHVSDPSAIRFSSEPDLGFTPTFFAVEGKEYAVALLPLPLDLEAGACTLTLAYGGITRTLDMTVAARKTRASDLVVSNAVYTSYYTDALREAFTAELAPYLASSTDRQLWDGEFQKIFEDTAIKCGYGRLRTIVVGKKATKEQFIQETVMYKAAAGTEIKATAAGEVVFSGYLDFCGNVVILEHGYGLKSWYMHLESATVKPGDTVEAGGVIGKAGKTGFFTSDYTGVEFGMSVYDRFFCPYDLWPDGELKGLPFKTVR